MKTTALAFLSTLALSAPCIAQGDLLPAFPREIVGEGRAGSLAYFKGDTKPFTGILVDERTNNRLGEYKNGYKNGLFRGYNANGKKELEERFIDGLRQGVHLEWFADGVKKAECMYVDGRKNGTCTEWFHNNKTRSSYVFVNDQIADGRYATYLETGLKDTETSYKDGQLTSTARYVDGKLIDLSELSVELNPSGSKKSAGFLKNGKKDGLWTAWYERGQKKSEDLYKDGAQDGQSRTWFENGRKESEGAYKEGKKEGLWTTWSERIGCTGCTGGASGVLKKSEGTWQDGRQEGRWTMWLDDGRKEFEGDYANGKRNGVGTLYRDQEVPSMGGGFGYKDGSYAGDWKDDLREGRGRLTAPDGRLLYSGEFKNGHPEGQGTSFNDGRMVEYEGVWKAGRPHGVGSLRRFSTGAGRDGAATIVGRVVWEGTFVAGLLQGQGVLTRADEDGFTLKFVGEFKNNGMFNGILSSTSADGKKLVLEYKDGKPGLTKRP